MGLLQDIVRRITIRGQTEGVDETTGKLRAMAGAQAEVAVASDKTTRSVISLENRLRSIERQVDAEARAAQNMARITRDLNAAREQGLITVARQNQLIALASERYRVHGESATKAATGVRLLKEASLGFIGGLGAGVLLGGISQLPGAINDAVDRLGNTANVAETLGVTTKALQELRFAARLSDVEITTLDSALGRFSVNLAKASLNDGPLSDILKANKMKVSGDLLTDLKRYADLIKNATDQESRNLLVTTAFGKSADEMGRLFKNGGAGIEEWVRQAENAGAVLSDDKLQRARDLNDELTALKPQLEAAGAEFALMVMPGEIAALQTLNTALRDTRDIFTAIANLDFQGVLRLAGSPTFQTIMVFVANPGMAAAMMANTGKAYIQQPAEITINGGRTLKPNDWPSHLLKPPTKLPVTPDADAQAAIKAKKAYDDLLLSGRQYIEQQQLLVQTLGMSDLAAAKLTKTHELLNKAESAGIKLTPEQRRELMMLADEMASAQVEAEKLTELVGTMADALVGMFDKPIKSAEEFFDTVLGGFASLGKANLKTSFEAILTGKGFAANDNARSTGPIEFGSSGYAKVIEDAVKSGTMGGFGDFLKSNAGNLGAGLGGLGMGYQTQSPLMGAAGGALAGAAAGPWGALIGGIAGFVGGLLGMNEALEKAKKEVNDNRASIDQFIAAGFGREISADAVALAQFKAQGAQLIELAKAAGDTRLVAQIKAATEAYRDTLRADGVRDRFESARENAIEAYQREAEALEQVRDRTKDFIASIKEYRDGLKLDREFSPLNPKQMMLEARKQFDLIAKKARLGDADAQGQLQGAASSYLSSARDYLGSSEAYQAIFRSVDQALGGVLGAAGGQLGSAERQLAATNKSLARLGDVHSAVLSVTQALKNLQKLETAAAKLRGAEAKDLLKEIRTLNKRLGVASVKKPNQAAA